jgi:hypothetical protein
MFRMTAVSTAEHAEHAEESTISIVGIARVCNDIRPARRALRCICLSRERNRPGEGPSAISTQNQRHRRLVLQHNGSDRLTLRWSGLEEAVIAYDPGPNCDLGCATNQGRILASGATLVGRMVSRPISASNCRARTKFRNGTVPVSSIGLQMSQLIPGQQPGYAPAANQGTQSLTEGHASQDDALWSAATSTYIMRRYHVKPMAGRTGYWDVLEGKSVAV